MTAFHLQSVLEERDSLAARQPEVIRNTEARLGSNELRTRIETMFVRFEVRHRLAAGEGRILLLDTGVRL